MEKAVRHTSRPEGGGGGRSPKTEGASARKAELLAGDSTSQSHPCSYADWRKRLVKLAQRIGSYEQVPSYKQIVSELPAGSLSHGYAVTAPSGRELRGAVRKKGSLQIFYFATSP